MIYPPTGGFTDYNTPTGVLYVATYLKKHGYNVKFIDCSITKNFLEIILAEVKDAIALCSYCMSIHIKYIIPLLTSVKQVNPNIKVILGGPHPTLFPEQTAADPLIDFVCIGEGEETTLELINFIVDPKNNKNYSDIKGICYNNGNEIITTLIRPFIDMDKLPFIDWELMEPSAIKSMSDKIARVQTSRGCPFLCSFCINVVSKNSKMRYRSPKLVVDEMEYLVKKFNVKRIGIRDEVFLMNRKNVQEICEEIIHRNLKITWLCNPHIRFLRENWTSENLLNLMKKSGCNKLQGGGESGSQRVLDMLHKTVSPLDILNFVKRCKKHNIVPLIAFMTGLPTETKKEQLQTLRLIYKILESNPATFINGPATFRVYPGGELYNQCIQNYNLKMPTSFRDWIHSDTIGGYKNPWIDHLYFSQNLWSHVTFARLDKLNQLTSVCKKISKKYNIILAILAFFYGKISHFRLKHNFYHINIDFYILYLYWRLNGEIPEFS